MYSYKHIFIHLFTYLGYIMLYFTLLHVATLWSAILEPASWKPVLHERNMHAHLSIHLYIICHIMFKSAFFGQASHIQVHAFQVHAFAGLCSCGRLCAFANLRAIEGFRRLGSIENFDNIECTWRFMGSYKKGYKKGNYSCNLF